MCVRRNKSAQPSSTLTHIQIVEVHAASQMEDG